MNYKKELEEIYKNMTVGELKAILADKEIRDTLPIHRAMHLKSASVALSDHPDSFKERTFFMDHLVGKPVQQVQQTVNMAVFAVPYTKPEDVMTVEEWSAKVKKDVEARALVNVTNDKL